MRTNFSGRVRNTSLPSTHALMPLFEAVVNSIHSIEDIGNDFSSSRITVSIIRSDQALLPLEKDTEKPKEIVGFKITDNGIGFDDHNLQSFETLDSDNKREKGCRGVGRLLWLKAFDDIKIKSVYEIDKRLKGREFSFDADKGIKALRNFQDDCAKRETVVELKGLKKNYKNHIPKTLKSISKALLEHFLWYFARTGSCPSITIEDGSEKISLNKLYEECKLEAIFNEEIEIEDHNFSIMHIKFRNLSVAKQTLSFCAANRVIKEEAISKKIPGMPSKLQDDIGEFIYSCYVSSLFLDERVRSERTSFDIEENTEGFFEEIEISFNMIRNAIVDRIQKYLAKELENNIRDSKERVEKFTHKVPRYRPLLKYLTDNDYMISSTKDNKGVELYLHECFARIENEILEEGHNVLAVQQGEDSNNYKARINKYVNAVGDLKKSDLANYLFHRKTIIELLKESLNCISIGDKKRYVTEEVIHELIVPMKCDSGSVAMNNCNLWLIDEKLAFHDYLASDLPLNSVPFTGSKDKDRPDVCSLEVYDKPLLVSEKKGDSIPSTLASLTIVEIKRPMRDDAKADTKTDPIDQVFTYLEKIREGQVQTPEGRPINLDGEVPGYCYVICDLTEKVKKCCKRWNLTKTGDHMGYFGYHNEYKSYIEVVSFDKLIAYAEKRQQRFFEVLGMPLQ
ncbi:ATP-binding protein [Bartonella harrusi]|uniref:ATP-binding protein n=1 Tax=Bartonella harrusi TaxID=2961895 RepID=A0ABY5ETV1_9HYPH|nr:ATP-binding protein [Bartonella harrusi]UTO28677.1 ATP-binding protein [Bartonella harrusi]